MRMAKAAIGCRPIHRGGAGHLKSALSSVTASVQCKHDRWSDQSTDAGPYNFAISNIESLDADIRRETYESRRLADLISPLSMHFQPPINRMGLARELPYLFGHCPISSREQPCGGERLSLLPKHPQEVPG